MRKLSIILAVLIVASGAHAQSTGPLGFGPYACSFTSQDGRSCRAVDKTYQPISGEVIFPDTPTDEQLKTAFPGYAAWLEAQQAQQQAQAAYDATIGAGLTIASQGHPAANGTYAIQASDRSNIAGTYSGIKSGDGLPGGAATFNYPQIDTVHFGNFDATTFAAFAKAVRDRVYAASQGNFSTATVQLP